MIGAIPSAVLFGVDGQRVTAEVHVGGDQPSFSVVGLPDTSCREARDRVRSAFDSCGFGWPDGRITVNLAPSAVPKAGSGLDLAIAIGLLVAIGELPFACVRDTAFIGELGLDGTIRTVTGVLPLAASLTDAAIVVPSADVHEAMALQRHTVRHAHTLRELVEALRGDAPFPDLPKLAPPTCAPVDPPDLADVHGQEVARLALELAAAGGHHVLLVGPPGAGKSMLAKRLPGLLPDLGSQDSIDVSRIHSAARLALPPNGLITTVPLRAPHHGASAVSMVGGGTATMRPGEISLAHAGVLFLDELGEFVPVVLDALRQPLEEGVVRISRARGTATYPARFLLVAAMNPCPCGASGGPGSCRCSDAARLRYARRLSGPLLDRFDLRVHVHRPDAADLLGGCPGESTAAVRARVLAARERAAARGVRCNAELSDDQLEDVTPLHPAVRTRFLHAIDRGTLSARGLRRVRSVCRTIADLRDGDDLVTPDVAELGLLLRSEIVSGREVAGV